MNEKQAYIPVYLEIMKWEQSEDIITTSGKESPKIPAYIRYEEDESVD